MFLGEIQIIHLLVKIEHSDDGIKGFFNQHPALFKRVVAKILWILHSVRVCIAQITI